MNNETHVIPDGDRVYLRISGKLFEDRPYSPSIIRQQGEDGISVDWNRYSTAQECLGRGNPEVDGIISFGVLCIRTIELSVGGLPPHLEVVHKPEEFNYSHSIIVKLPEKKRKADIRIIRNLMYGCIELEIHCPKMLNNLD